MAISLLTSLSAQTVCGHWRPENSQAHSFAYRASSSPIIMHTGLGVYLPIVFYLAIWAGFGLSIFWRPLAGLLLLAPLLPNETMRYKLANLPLGSQAIDILMLGVAIGLLKNRRQLLPAIGLRRPFLILAFYTYLSLWLGSLLNHYELPLWFSVERVSTWKNFIRMPFLAFLAYGAIESVSDITALMVSFCAGTVLVERGYFLSIRGKDFSSFSYGLRDAGPLGTAGENGLAAFLAQTALLFVGFAKSVRRIPKLLLMTVAGLGVIALALTFSRGGYLGLVVGFIYLAFFLNRKWVPALVIAGILLCVAPTLLVPPSVVERVQMTDSGGSLDPSSEGRIVMWEKAMSFFSDYPITGTGFNTFWYLTSGDELHDTHNYYLKVLCEQGILGVGAFLWLLWSCWFACRRLIRTAEDDRLLALGIGGCAYIVCVVVVNIFGDRFNYISISGYTFLLIGMIERGVAISAGRLTHGGPENAQTSMEITDDCEVAAQLI